MNKTTATSPAGRIGAGNVSIRGTANFLGVNDNVRRRHSLYTFNDDNCDNVLLRDVSSSSDSLFTDPPLSPNSTSVVTAPLADSPGDLCLNSTATDNDDEFLDGEDDDDDVDSSATATSTTTKKTNKNLTHNKSLSYTAVQLPTNLEQHLLAAAAAANANAIQAKKQRPLSEISIASGDTSGILSPTTARAIYELRKRHQADKLSLLSVAKTSYLEIVPTELPTESSPESTDEQMAMHLGKKLAQVLSGNSAGAGGVTNAAGVGTGVNTNSAGTPGSPLPDNGNYFIAATTPTTTATNELFNIAKAKKIELPSLSSRLVASAAPSLDSHGMQSTTGEYRKQNNIYNIIRRKLRG